MNGFLAHSTGRSCLQCKIGVDSERGYQTIDLDAIPLRTHAQTVTHMQQFHNAPKSSKETLAEKNGVRLESQIVSEQSAYSTLPSFK